MCFLKSDARERAVPGRAPVASAFHDPGFDVIARGERLQIATGNDSGEAGQRIAHEKRALLPVTCKKIARREAAEQLLLHVR